MISHHPGESNRSASLAAEYMAANSSRLGHARLTTLLGIVLLGPIAAPAPLASCPKRRLDLAVDTGSNATRLPCLRAMLLHFAMTSGLQFASTTTQPGLLRWMSGSQNHSRSNCCSESSTMPISAMAMRRSFFASLMATYCAVRAPDVAGRT